MAKGAALSEGSTGENIQHFAAIRVRVIGRGNLQIMVNSVDQVRYKALVPIAILAKGRPSQTRLVNFVEQRASFEIKTIESDNYINVSRITVYVKESATSYPGN